VWRGGGWGACAYRVSACGLLPFNMQDMGGVQLPERAQRALPSPAALFLHFSTCHRHTDLGYLKGDWHIPFYFASFWWEGRLHSLFHRSP